MLSSTPISPVHSSPHHLFSCLAPRGGGGGNGTFQGRVGHFQSQNRKNRPIFATGLVDRNFSPQSTRRTQRLRRQKDLSPLSVKYLSRRLRTAISGDSRRFLCVLRVLCSQPVMLRVQPVKDRPREIG